MKPAHYFFIALLCLPVLANEKGIAQSSIERDTQELQRLETVWNEAHVNGDAASLEKLWADDLEVAVPHMPVLTRADVTKFARSGRMKFKVYRSSDLHIRVYDSAAVVSGRLQRIRTLGDKEVSDDWQFTKVYVRKDPQWRVVSFHASERPQE